MPIKLTKLCKKFPFANKFPRYCEIHAHIYDLQSRFPHLVRVEQIGFSIQGRPIDMVVVQRNPERPKHGVMIEGGVHAREWLSHTTVLYFLNYILSDSEMLDYMDYYIIPCLNPDGYVYTHTCDRLWRKNMNPNGSHDKEQWGVDVNRNFSFGYGRRGSSDNPADSMYRGDSCFSEPESRSVAFALNQYGPYIKLYIAIHCYGNLIMYPYGFTKRKLKDEPHLKACGLYAAKNMKCVYRNSRSFKVGSLWKAMYFSAGGSSDYVRGVHKVKFSYTIELHKGGRSGFDPPASRIIKVARETTAGIKSMMLYVHKFYRRRTRQGTKEKSFLCQAYCRPELRLSSSHVSLGVISDDPFSDPDVNKC